MSELRKDPIVGRWVIISTERGKRPADFIHREKLKPSKLGHLCPFCEGNEDKTPPEIYALRNPDTRPNSPGWQVRVVANKFPALRLRGDSGRREVGMFDMMNGIGAHEVIIESPDHGKTLTDFDLPHLKKVLSVYKERSLDLKKNQRLKYILLFKNYGQDAGASLEHSHSQLIATSIIPKRIKEKLQGAKRYFDYKQRCIFCDIINQEIDYGVRIIGVSHDFVAMAPFAARFPFEVWILPRRHSPDFDRSSNEELRGLGKILRSILRRLSRVLNNPSYNFVLHVAPNRSPRRGYWQTIDKDYHWHLEIMPRIVKTGGFEWGTGFYINPTPPEEAATYLRELEEERPLVDSK
jgi:UDPglucose--hexose-1-phosphate uridylyltransferase